jgi:hypothetical protein
LDTHWVGGVAGEPSEGTGGQSASIRDPDGRLERMTRTTTAKPVAVVFILLGARSLWPNSCQRFNTDECRLLPEADIQIQMCQSAGQIFRVVRTRESSDIKQSLCRWKRRLSTAFRLFTPCEKYRQLDAADARWV